MAKKFMYVCLGILALTLAFHLGAQYGKAETMVDQSGTGIVAVYTQRAGPAIDALLDNGEVWSYWMGAGWEHSPSGYDTPIAPSEIKFWTLTRFVSQSNELWVHGGGVWTNYGAPPTGPSLTQPTTWSRIKAEFGDEGSQ
jgi:hypothetical protein